MRQYKRGVVARIGERRREIVPRIEFHAADVYEPAVGLASWK